MVETENGATSLSDRLQRTLVVHDVLCGKCQVFQYKMKKHDSDDDMENTSFKKDTSGPPSSNANGSDKVFATGFCPEASMAPHAPLALW